MDSDPEFDKFVTALEQQCLSDEEKHRKSFINFITRRNKGLDKGMNWNQGKFNQPWRGTSQYRFPILPRPPEQMNDIQQRWITMRGQPREQQYLRHLAIESNLLELTFALTTKVRALACIKVLQLTIRNGSEHKETNSRRV